MKLEQAQPLALYLLVGCALGTVLSCGLFGPGWALLVVGLVLGSLLVPLSRREKFAKSRLQGAVVALIFCALLLDVVRGQRDIISGATLFLIAVLISRLYTSRGAAESTQILMLSLLVVLAGSALSTQLMFAPYFVGFVVCSVWALTTTQLTKEAAGQRSGVRVQGRFWLTTSILALVIFAQTTAFFFFFPRFGTGALQLRNRATKAQIGFTDHVELGVAADLAADNSVVLRLDFAGAMPPEPPERMYFRGATLTAFDGKHWQKSDVTLHTLSASADGFYHLRPLADADVSYRLYQEPTDSDLVFLPEPTTAFGFTSEARLVQSTNRVKFFALPSGEVTAFKPAPMSLHLEAYLGQKNIGPKDPPSALNKELPEGMSREVLTLAERWAAGTDSPAAFAESVRQHLQLGFDYTTKLVAPPVGRDPIAFFLFDHRSGDCEYFASALAVLLRARGVPTRLVSGYFGAAYNRYGKYWSVSESRAHTWVEFWDDGWHRIDPTPVTDGALGPSTAQQIVDVMRYRWSRYVVDFDLDLQIEALHATKKFFSRPAPTLQPQIEALQAWWSNNRTDVLLITALALLGWLWWLRSRYIQRKITAPTRLYRSFERLMQKRGVLREASCAPERFARLVKEKRPELADEVERFTDAYLIARFGGELAATVRMRSSLKRLRGGGFAAPPERR